jgi:hypothetical protein
LFSGGEKVKRTLLLAIGVSVLVWMACDEVHNGRPSLNGVKGTVIDSLTRVPIDSAWVDMDTLALHEVYTDSLGNYRMPVGYRGKYFIYCGKNAYVTKKKEITFTGNGITAEMNFELASFTPSQVKEETR